MKCPHCGFRNLPGTKFCGACGTDLTVQTSNAFEPFYPPRAWGRQFRQMHPEAEIARSRWRRWFPSRQPDLSPTETLRQRTERRRMRRLIWLTAIRSLAGLIPGLGLLMEKRAREGWQLLGVFVFCVAVVALCWRNFLSNIALLAIAVLLVYSVGATFFAAWQRNNLPTLSTLQKVGIWLTVISLFFWTYTVGLAALNFWFGLAFVPFGAGNDSVIERGNMLLYSRLERHLTSIEVGDYVVFDGRNANVNLPVGFNYGDYFAFRVGATIIGRVKSFHRKVDGTEIAIEVPMFIGRQEVWGQAFVPKEAVQGKVIAILNPPPKRRWLP
ncbi:MAG: zinc ribbon domain-containing protein [Armatimonadetes bacterium]|nr:zinc ribbon domain-containing protein [Armatimonadota bacterium]